MKIAIAHYSSSKDISGVTTWLENLVLHLQKDGLHPVVHFHHLGMDVKKSSLAPRLQDAGVSVEVVPRSRSFVGDIVQTTKFLNRVKPDIFLPQCLHAHFFAAAIAGEQGLPWALTIHSDDPDYWTIAKARPPVNHGGNIVCVSEHIAQLVVNDKVDSDPNVIPCGVKVSNQIATHSKKPFRIIYSGRLVELQKRLSLVIETLILACKADNTIEGKVIGDGPAMDSSRKTVADAGMENRITFTGFLTPLKVKTELLNAQAILLMSDFEGLPLALLEAMAVGVVPVVRSIPSGIPEIIHHEKTGLLVDDQPENAAKAICRLSSDLELWQLCSKAGRKLIMERYSEDISYSHWLDLIDMLYTKSKINYPIRLPRQILSPDEKRQFGAGYPSSWMWTASIIKRELHNVSRILLGK